MPFRVRSSLLGCGDDNHRRLSGARVTTWGSPQTAASTTWLKRFFASCRDHHIDTSPVIHKAWLDCLDAGLCREGGLGATGSLASAVRTTQAATAAIEQAIHALRKALGT
jgi:hypothetical protein